MRLSKIYKQAKEILSQYVSVIFVVALMIPVWMLANTEKDTLWISVACIMIPLGGYTLFAAMARRSGVMVWLGLPLIILSAFQIVLSYLFGDTVVAADMFLNLFTTNHGEAGELLSNLYPAIVVVLCVYMPVLWIAAIHIHKQIALDARQRRGMVIAGTATLLTGCIMLGCSANRDITSIIRDDVFPVNALYNMSVAISEAYDISHYVESSRYFKHHATRCSTPACKEVYVLVIGEASRAASWQTYGYERKTTPLLAAREDVVWFRNVLTQSNTTHKSVPMILSSVHTSQHEELYRRSGILALFNEAGFTTYFISNQSPQGAMIDNLASQAQHVIYVEEPRLDIQLVEAMRKAIGEEQSEKIFFVLHTYGSHFSYRQRYPREFARFTPDNEVMINSRNVSLLRNAYDNSIYYTDYCIDNIINTLDTLENVSAAMYYCADHGEDLFDGDKKRFLHSSPMVTYHQLHVASLAWFSDVYSKMYAHKIRAARRNTHAPASTYSVFHTMADMADIASPYVKNSASLLSLNFDYGATRYYLNDRNQAVKFDDGIGIDNYERKQFFEHGIEP